MYPWAQRPEGLDLLLGAGDDHRVEAKEKARQRGRDGPEEDAAFHSICAILLSAPSRLKLVDLQRRYLRAAAFGMHFEREIISLRLERHRDVGQTVTGEELDRKSTR